MSKTVKIKTSGTHNFKTDEKSNGTTYVFANETVANSSTINLYLTGEYVDWGSYCYKNGNDLYFVAIYSDGSDYSSSLAKIKDYYKYSSADKQDLVTFDGYSLYKDATDDSWTYAKKRATDFALGGKIFGDSGTTTYDISNTTFGDTTIVDVGGKDKYNIKNLGPAENNLVYIKEPFGNDKYEISDSRGINIEDFAGNDKYAVKDCAYINDSNDFEIFDYAGNDNYQFDNVQVPYTNQKFFMYDYYGNDVYNLKNVMNIDIAGWEYKQNVKGNDKYTVKDSYNVQITDYKGTDKYVMTNIEKTLTIQDYSYANDSYTILGSENVYVYDQGGKDAYKVSNSNSVAIQDVFEDGKSVSESDKYTVTNSSNIEIQDSCGKDTYNISGSYNKKTKIITYTENVTINDGYNENVSNPALDNDKYNLTYVINDPNNCEIWDSRGSNTYNIKNSEGIKISSCAESGKDTYNITSSKNIIIVDDGIIENSSDVYSVKLAKGGDVHITDAGGDKDKLTISNLNKKNLVYMSNYQKNSGFDSENSLILFDKATNGYVQINDMFEKKGDNSYSTSDFGDGLIETVKAGSKKVNTTDATMIDKLNEVRATVVAWFGVHTAYASVADVLQSENEADISGIIACFEGNGAG